ncbi:MerR family transcriptional regulator [Paenibacillus sp. UNC451MF]|uniref:MerR family transcriptional regulator n=1 Tax=Paenibacillus sp. UNC451MF TaxID=1449063 RepID=UPI00068DC714|nr:MerR family transcriptional regulator [Paenibacillus sp. UNC451MF]
MDSTLYSISQFARKAGVSIRTLRYYDKKGLLTPTHFNSSGFRQYTDSDLSRLQYIIGLKFLGFSLNEIHILLQTGPKHLPEMLAQQKAMMITKRQQLDMIIGVMENTEAFLQANPTDMQGVIKVILALQMEPINESLQKHLTAEQASSMKELVKNAYSDEALNKIRERKWSEEDLQRRQQDYAMFRQELRRLTSMAADPSGEDSQKMAALLDFMNQRFSGGDPAIKAGMKNTWSSFQSLPEGQKAQAYHIPDAEVAFLKQAMTFYYKNNRTNG